METRAPLTPRLVHRPLLFGLKCVLQEAAGRAWAACVCACMCACRIRAQPSTPPLRHGPGSPSGASGAERAPEPASPWWQRSGRQATPPRSESADLRLRFAGGYPRGRPRTGPGAAGGGQSKSSEALPLWPRLRAARLRLWVLEQDGNKHGREQAWAVRPGPTWLAESERHHRTASAARAGFLPPEPPCPRSFR